MGEAVHAHGGLWIAPAAPGFDARQVGGTTVVERRDGATLRARARRRDGLVARRGRPDQLERVQREHPHRAEPQLRLALPASVVADVRGARLPEVREFDSSEPAATGVSYGLPLLGGSGAVLRRGPPALSQTLAVTWPPRSRSHSSRVRRSPNSRLVAPPTRVYGRVEEDLT